MYNQGRRKKTISLNSHNSLVFRNGREASEFRTMAYQISPSNGQLLVTVFTNATSKPCVYVVLKDYRSTPENKTVATNIHHVEQHNYHINSNSNVKRN